MSHFYSSNKFLIQDCGGDLEVLCDWLKAIGPANYTHLKQLYILSQYNTPASKVTDLEWYVRWLYAQGKLPMTIQEEKKVQIERYYSGKSVPGSKYLLGMPTVQPSI